MVTRSITAAPWALPTMLGAARAELWKGAWPGWRYLHESESLADIVNPSAEAAVRRLGRRVPQLGDAVRSRHDLVARLWNVSVFFGNVVKK